MDKTGDEIFVNKEEIRILKLLEKREACNCGEIIQELSLSANKVSTLIAPMIEKGLIKYQDQSSLLVLNVDLK